MFFFLLWSYFSSLHCCFFVFQAANYLDIKGLLDVTCKTVANMIKGKTPEEIRKTFNIKNDFTEEEEAQVLIPGKEHMCKITKLFFSTDLLSSSGTQREPVV